MQMGKDWLQTVLKDRTDHAERYVETAFGWFYRKICSVLWSVVLILTPCTISAVYRVDSMCRMCDGKIHYEEIT